MSYLNRLSEWIKKAGLRGDWKRIEDDFGRANTRELKLKDNSILRVTRGESGHRNYKRLFKITRQGGRSRLKIGRNISTSPGYGGGHYVSSVNRSGVGVATKKRLVRQTLFRSLEKSTNGFHAKPGQKVKGKRFIVIGKMKRGYKRAGREIFEPSVTTHN